VTHLKICFQTLMVPLLLIAAVPAMAAPQMQKEAAYFTNLEADLNWFDAAQKSIDPRDTRTLFLRVYQSVTLEMTNMFAENQFQHPEWVNALMLKYVSLYKNALDCDASGACPVSPAWQIAFSENRSGKMTPAGQLLIAISAHVNRDLPIALAALGSTRFDDITYHQDFVKISMIFQRRMPALIKLVQEYETCRVNSVDEKIILAVIQHAIGGTREKAWVWAQKLAAAQTLEQENQIIKGIEQHAHNENRSLFLLAPAPAFLICL
jgi:hypothetical protein